MFHSVWFLNSNELSAFFEHLKLSLDSTCCSTQYLIVACVKVVLICSISLLEALKNDLLFNSFCKHVLILAHLHSCSLFLLVIFPYVERKLHLLQ
jgi:hypothetical protein